MATNVETPAAPSNQPKENQVRLAFPLPGEVGTPPPSQNPSQPVQGQPYPGQPYPGQPYPGQPYPGQPYPGQPNPGQPYPGQQYPPQQYPPQQYPGQQYAPPAQHTIVVMSTAAPQLPAYWSTVPSNVVCPGCHEAVTTRVTSQVGCGTWVWVGGLCFVGCWPCCLIPFCVDSCKDKTHECPKCGRMLGSYRMM